MTRWALLCAAVVVAIQAVIPATQVSPTRVSPTQVSPTQVSPTQAPAERAPVKLTATALVMGGTNQVLSIPPWTPQQIRDYLLHADFDFVAPTGLCTGGDPGCHLLAVYTPEELRPFTGFGDMTLDASVAAGRANLDDCIRGSACMVTMSPYVDTGQQQLTDTSYVVNGISQSAIIASEQKRFLIAHPVAGRTISFVLISNPGRPNGGLLERFVGAYVPYLGITFNGATVTNSARSSPLTTVDVTRQYDGWSDFPTNPLNILAGVNALFGALYLHAGYLDIDQPPQLQGHYQDTTYYLHPSPILPILQPLSQIPFIGTVLALTLDAPLRVLVEAGYDRTINPGQPTPAQFLYFPNPIATAIDLAVAIPTGWDDAIAYVTGNPSYRPFRTTPQPVYGVGGPPVYAGAVDPYGPVAPLSPDSASAPDPNAAAAEPISSPPDAPASSSRPVARTSRPASVGRTAAAAHTVRDSPVSASVNAAATAQRPSESGGERSTARRAGRGGSRGGS